LAKKSAYVSASTMSSPSANSAAGLPPLIAGLLSRETHPDASCTPRLIETHISWVILAGDYAYKIKKPVNLGFLDFSTLEKRQHFCEEELRLNTRLAPHIYLAAVAITGTPEKPQIEGSGPAIEWAVKMRAFPADATLDREPNIGTEQIDAIAERIADFHADIAVAPPESVYGLPAQVSEPVLTNFSALRQRLPANDNHLSTLLGALQTWSVNESQRLAPHFAARKASGFIRECHGDLHLGNIAWVEDKPLIFDALEFNTALRQIDVISEIAFLSMDLQHRGRSDLAWRLLDRYLEQSGDYGSGLTGLAYYQVYRAMVRAKVAAILATAQAEASGKAADFAECLNYLQLAERLTRQQRPALLLMHGVSGSGKTWLSQHLLEQLGGIRLRSDVVRKRLFGLKPLQDSSAIPGGIYTPEAGKLTLESLLENTRTVLAAGFLVIVDATFINSIWRAPFQALAEELHIEWRIVSLAAPAETLRERIVRRQQHGTDASEAGLSVLESQLAILEPLNTAELTHALQAPTESSAADWLDRIRTSLEQPLS
jgi:aminoglycoside phosphotransferase family enzyme/gluconate kinase